MHYRPANMVVSVAGDCTHEAVAAELESRFAGTGRRGSTQRRRPGPDTVRSMWCAGPTEQAHLVYGAAR